MTHRTHLMDDHTRFTPARKNRHTLVLGADSASLSKVHGTLVICCWDTMSREGKRGARKWWNSYLTVACSNRTYLSFGGKLITLIVLRWALRPALFLDAERADVSVQTLGFVCGSLHLTPWPKHIKDHQKRGCEIPHIGSVSIMRSYSPSISVNINRWKMHGKCTQTTKQIMWMSENLNCLEGGRCFFLELSIAAPTPAALPIPTADHSEVYHYSNMIATLDYSDCRSLFLLVVTCSTHFCLTFF